MRPERSAEVTVQGLISHSKDLRFHSKYDKLLKVLSRVMTRSGLQLKIIQPAVRSTHYRKRAIFFISTKDMFVADELLRVYEKVGGWGGEKFHNAKRKLQSWNE